MSYHASSDLSWSDTVHVEIHCRVYTHVSRAQGDLTYRLGNQFQASGGLALGEHNSCDGVDERYSDRLRCGTLAVYLRKSCVFTALQ
jgi:hypothetical protein